MLNHAMKRPMPSTSCGFLFPLRVLSRTHGTYLFTFQNLLRAQFRVHSFAPECCYLCVCRWNLCVWYFSGPSNFTHTHTQMHARHKFGIYTKLCEQYSGLLFVAADELSSAARGCGSTTGGGQWRDGSQIQGIHASNMQPIHIQAGGLRLRAKMR